MARPADVKLLVDVNTCLDVLLDRVPFAGASTRLWSLVERGKVRGLLPAHGVTTIHYLVSKERGSATGRRFAADLLQVFGVAAVNQAVLKRALELRMPDLEDAVCAAAAETAGCDLLVTRDRKDYACSPVPAVDPITALAIVEGGGPGGVSERPARYQSRRKSPAVRRRRTRGGAGAAR